MTLIIDGDLYTLHVIRKREIISPPVLITKCYAMIERGVSDISMEESKRVGANIGDLSLHQAGS